MNRHLKEKGKSDERNTGEKKMERQIQDAGKPMQKRCQSETEEMIEME